MVSVLDIALSSLNAASAKAAASANNIANSRSISEKPSKTGSSSPFIPQDVVQVYNPLGGVNVSIKDQKKSQVISSPNDTNQNNNTQSVPTVNTSEELAKTSEAEFAYKATLNLIATSDKMSDKLFDIFA